MRPRHAVRRHSTPGARQRLVSSSSRTRTSPVPVQSCSFSYVSSSAFSYELLDHLTVASDCSPELSRAIVTMLFPMCCVWFIPAHFMAALELFRDQPSDVGPFPESCAGPVPLVSAAYASSS